ncbi:MAG: hypothetical protein LC118_19880 [Dehalococcoidia bacterium]|nr:hypothetical protein [Dehalococcoidia bacterium]
MKPPAFTPLRVDRNVSREARLIETHPELPAVYDVARRATTTEHGARTAIGEGAAVARQDRSTGTGGDHRKFA